MTKRNINIDTLTIRLPGGWQGDPVYLARKLSQQLQQQAQELTSGKQISMTLSGPFANNPRLVAEQFSRQLPSRKVASTSKKGHSE